jgi:hypothetical protein
MKSETADSQSTQSLPAPEAPACLDVWKRALAGKKRAGGSTPLAQQMPGLHHIELNLGDIDQLFNTMDPLPFHEKDLDDDAAEFILSWAQEYHRHEPVDLILHLEKHPDGYTAQQLVQNAVHNYYSNPDMRARMLEFLGGHTLSQATSHYLTAGDTKESRHRQPAV